MDEYCCTRLFSRLTSQKQDQQQLELSQNGEEGCQDDLITDYLRWQPHIGLNPKNVAMATQNNSLLFYYETKAVFSTQQVFSV